MVINVNKAYLVGKPIKPLPVLDKKKIEQCKADVEKYIK